MLRPTDVPNLSHDPSLPLVYSTLRALDDPDDLRRFLDLRSERDRIDAELASLSPVILAALEAEDGSRLDVSGYVIEARIRRSYAYSDEVTETEAYLRDLRATERGNGVARVTQATGYVQVSRSRAEADDRARVSLAMAEHALALAA